MSIYKTKVFSKWAIKEGLDDERLLNAIEEIENGLVDVNLGGNVFKKRVSIGKKGKSGGVRTLVAYKIDDKAFFIYGFSKSVQANIKEDELKVLKLFAKTLLSYKKKDLMKAIEMGALIEVENNG